MPGFLLRWLLWIGVLFLHLLYMCQGAAIFTYAGRGSCYDDNLPGQNSSLRSPRTLWMSPQKDLYILDAADVRIRVWNATSGQLQIFAGTSFPQYNGDNIPATSANIQGLRGMTGDTASNIYVSAGIQVIRKIDQQTRIISRYAGTHGSAGSSGDGGHRLNCRFSGMRALFIFQEYMFIADAGNNKIRRIDMNSNIISTYVGTGNAGNTNNVVATAADIWAPQNMWITSVGDLYFIDINNYRIKKVDSATKLVTTVVGDGFSNWTSVNGNGRFFSIGYAECLTGDRHGNLYFASDNNYRVLKVSNITNEVTYWAGTGNYLLTYGGENTPRLSTSLSRMRGCWMDDDDENSDGPILYSSEFDIYRVRKITDKVETIAGNGKFCVDNDENVAATSARMDPIAVWIDTNSGVLYFTTNSDHRVRKIDVAGTISTVAGNGYFVYQGDDVQATSTSLNYPIGLTGAYEGEILFISDTSNGRIRAVNMTTGIITTVAGQGWWCGQQQHNISARLAYFCNMRMIRYHNSSHSIYGADYSNHAIRRIDLATNIIFTVVGVIGTYGFVDNVAATMGLLYYPIDLWVTYDGDIYIADNSNARVRKVSATTGYLTTFAGTGSFVYSGDAGLAKSASFANLLGICMDRNERNIYVMGNALGRIRKINMATNIISLVGGNGDIMYGYNGDSKSATASQLSIQYTCDVDLDGTLYFPQLYTNRIRMITILAPTGQPTSQPTNPSSQPTSQPTNPTSHPSGQPTKQPLQCPTSQPTSQPSCQPTHQPTALPSSQPSLLPSAIPSSQPTAYPSMPTGHPTTVPSGQPQSSPTSFPSNSPTLHPTAKPSTQPSVPPTLQPSSQPTSPPSARPSIRPSSQPSDQPSSKPAVQPSFQPSCQPTLQPYAHPTSQPSLQPSRQPVTRPTSQPSSSPSTHPTGHPSKDPSSMPSVQPSSQPSQCPSNHPTTHPSLLPSTKPSRQPTTQPSSQPNTKPSYQPSTQPFSSPTVSPTGQPLKCPSGRPTAQPSKQPISMPSSYPSASPTSQPTPSPSTRPSTQPRGMPTAQPSAQPSSQPSIQPSVFPTRLPSAKPSCQPTLKPSAQPSKQPTTQPNILPSANPTVEPSIQPTTQPSSWPTQQPISRPSFQPTPTPSAQPSYQPMVVPTFAPSSRPSICLTKQPSAQPATPLPVFVPFENPTTSPTDLLRPTVSPSLHPVASVTPSIQPSHQPSVLPTSLSSPIMIERALISADGTHAKILLNIASNRGGYVNAFPCGEVLKSRNIDINNLFCQWSSDTEFSIYSALKMDSGVSFLKFYAVEIALLDTAIITSKLCTYSSNCNNFIVSEWLRFEVELWKELPLALDVSMPSEVRSCDAFTIDLSSNTFNGIYPWQSLTVKVNSTSFSSENVSRIERFFKYHSRPDVPFQVTSGLLLANRAYSFNFTLCNIFRVCARREVILNVTSLFAPIAPFTNILGPSYVTMYTSSALSLRSSGTTWCSVCGCKGELGSIQYSWKVFDESSRGLTPITSESTDLSIFSVQPFVFSPSMSYHIRSIVVDGALKRTGFSDILVHIVRQPPIAIITPSNNQVLKLGTRFNISGLASYDPNLAVKSSFGLIFFWRCEGFNFLTGEALNCPDFMTNTLNRSDGVISALVGTSPALVNQTVLLTLMVVDKFGLNSSASMEIRFVPLDAVSVAFETLSNALHKVDPSTVIKISTVVKSPGSSISCASSWAVDDPAVNMDAVIMSNISVAANINKFIIQFQPFALIPGATFVLSFRCGSVLNTMNIVTNRSPQGGVVVSYPDNGVEFSTVFWLSTSQWADDDLPLSFKFSSFAFQSGGEIVLQAISQFSFAFTTLPGGQAGKSFTRNVTAFAIDSFGAWSAASTSIEVNHMEESALQSAIVLALSNLTASSMTSSQLVNLISVSTSALNKVNCSAAPICSVLNRQSCSTVDNTCGPCLSDYVGEGGNKNSFCSASGALSAIDFTNGGASFKLCQKDSECDNWEQCRNQKCSVRLKECLQDCSGHGKCLFVDRYSTAIKLVPSCTIFESHCEAKCNCTAGFNGKSCEYSDEYLLKQQEIRIILLDALDLYVNAVGYQVDQSTVSTMVSQMTAVVRDEYDLNFASLRKTSTLVENILMSGINSSSVSPITMKPLLNIVDTSMLAQVRFISSNSSIEIGSEVNSAIQNILLYATTLISESDLSDSRSSFAADQFRYVAASSFDEGDIAAIPSTDMESVVKSDKFANYITSKSILYDGILEAVELNKNLWIGNTDSNTYSTPYALSNVLHVEVTSPKSERADPLSVYIRLKKIATIDGNMAQSYVFNTTCSFGQNSTVKYTCPNSGVDLVHHCRGVAGTFSSKCPIATVSCATTDLATQLVHAISNCFAVNETNDYVLCSCNMTVNDVKRRQLSVASPVVASFPSSAVSAGQEFLDQSGFVTVGLMIKYVGEEFADPFHEASDLMSADSAAHVITVIVMFGSLWALGGIALISLWAKRNYGSEGIKRDVTAGRKIGALTIGGLNEVKDENQMKLTALKRLIAYVDSVIPAIYLTGSHWSRMKDELLRHHAYLNLAFGYSKSSTTSRKHEYALLLQLLTVQTLLMFLLAVLYDLQGPDDDGSCDHIQTKAKCLQRRSIFDRDIPYCEWVPSSNEVTLPTVDYYVCEYREPQFTFIVGFYCAVVSSLFTAIILRPLTYLFDILSAPTEESIKASIVASAFQTVSSAARRASALAIQMKNIVLPSVKPSTDATKITSTRYIPPDTVQAYRQARLTVNKIGDKFQKDVSMAITSRTTARYYALQQSNVVTSPYNSTSQPSTSLLKSNTSVIVNLQMLKDSIRCQRSMLNSDELALFDKSWGINSSSGQFQLVDAHFAEYTCNRLAPPMEIIQHELVYVQEESKHIAKELEPCTDTHKGIELLQLFIEDLLGRTTPAAKIFRSKAEEDYHHLPVVSMRSKYAATAIILLLDAFFIYYSILKGFVKGNSWQRSYMFACIVQFIVEVFVFESFECLWINVVVPSFVAKEVHSIHATVQAAVEQLMFALTGRQDTFGNHMISQQESKVRDGEVDGRDDHSFADKKASKVVLNTPDYLFLSTNVACHYPNLIESLIIMAYQTYMPGELARKWKESHSMITKSKDFFVSGKYIQSLWVFTTVFSVMTISFAATVPFELQRMILRFLQPFILGGLILIYMTISSSRMLTLIFFGIVLGGLIFCVYKYFSSGESDGINDRDNEMQRVHPDVNHKNFPTSVQPENFQPSRSKDAHHTMNDQRILESLEEEVEQQHQMEVLHQKREKNAPPSKPSLSTSVSHMSLAVNEEELDEFSSFSSSSYSFSSDDGSESIKSFKSLKSRPPSGKTGRARNNAGLQHSSGNETGRSRTNSHQGHSKFLSSKNGKSGRRSRTQSSVDNSTARSRVASIDSAYARSRAQSDEIANYIIEVMTSDEDEMIEKQYEKKGSKNGKKKENMRSRLASDDTIQ